MIKSATLVTLKRSKFIGLLVKEDIYCFKCSLIFLMIMDVITIGWSPKSTMLSFEGMLQFDQQVWLW